MISCEKASIICNKTQYREASLWEKLNLRFHLFICKTCKAFTKKNTEFTSLCDKAGLQGISENEKIEMKERLNQHQ